MTTRWRGCGVLRKTDSRRHDSTALVANDAGAGRASPPPAVGEVLRIWLRLGCLRHDARRLNVVPCRLSWHDAGVPADEQPLPNLTALLNDAGRGNRAAREVVWCAIYGDVRAIAVRACAAEGLRTDLQPTLLVHEVFLKMFGGTSTLPAWENRRHFWGSVGRAMGQILVDFARSDNAQKRGGGRERVELDIAAGELADAGRACSPIVAEIVEALERLEDHSPESAHVARLRYLAGLSIEETAALLGIAPRSVTNRWIYARSWLRRAIAANDSRMEKDG